MYFVLIGQVLLFETVYRGIARTLYPMMSLVATQRVRYVFWVLRSVSVIMLFLGVGESLRKVLREQDMEE